ncbi:MAG: FeoB-associated Cys-rich membrane protein [Ruminococcus sp.]|nr:FeoB-associated Cys-rich membrane protein [Ruminococcus sp.]
MNVIDILLIIVIAAAVLFAVRHIVKDRKNGAVCCGDCSRCGKCNKI